MKRFSAACFAILMLSSLAVRAERRRDPFSQVEIDQLRDAAQDPDTRLKLYVKFARAKGLSNTRIVDWRAMPSDLGRSDVLVASDVLYEARTCELLADLLPQLGREALVADPDRITSGYFLELIEGRLECRTTTRRIGGVTVSIHRLTPAPSG